MFNVIIIFFNFLFFIFFNSPFIFYTGIASSLYFIEKFCTTVKLNDMLFTRPSAPFSVALAAVVVVIVLAGLPFASGTQAEQIPGDGATPMDAGCKWVDNAGKHISLAPFKGTAPDYYTSRHEDNGFFYTVNLCGSVDSSKCKSMTPDAVAIQSTERDSKCVSVLGAISPAAPPAWSQLGDKGYTIAFSGGDGGCEDPPFSRVTTFQLLCSDDVLAAELVHVIEDPKCVYTAQFKINCNVLRYGSLAGRWSFGTRFLFFAFMLVSMYIFVVMLLERRKMGDSAEWRFPDHQREFWSEFIMCAREGAALAYVAVQEGVMAWKEGRALGGSTSANRSRSGYDPVATTEPSSGSSSAGSKYGSGGGGGGGGGGGANKATLQDSDDELDGLSEL